MSDYYDSTFHLLASEMVAFCLLTLPLPYGIRKLLFRFLPKFPIVAKVVNTAFIIIVILFLDAFRRMVYFTAEADIAKSTLSTVHDVQFETETILAARNYYLQRNTYLAGFCVFLSFVLSRTFYIVLDLIHMQEAYMKHKQETEILILDQFEQIAELKERVKAAEAREKINAAEAKSCNDDQIKQIAELKETLKQETGKSTSSKMIELKEKLKATEAKAREYELLNIQIMQSHGPSQDWGWYRVRE
ncbi:hypothetical protein QCA50_014937 [Cerrena zonata]|uniref:Endoplasmic reticulum transmembrane protein n=1 Tax=Cerrena zonata TaxID=2478898 RepID=A0AAW0FQY0_9APHY